MCLSISLAAGLSVSGKTILDLYRTNNKLSRTLLSIIVASVISFGFVYFVYLIIGPWLNVISLPILYLWLGGSLAQLIFLDYLLPQSKEKINSARAILSISAFPLTSVIVIITIYAGSFAYLYITKLDKKTYLIPDDFEGEIIVIYDEDCGIIPPVENGRMVFDIPKSGVLVIQPEFEAGIIDSVWAETLFPLPLQG